MGFDAKYNEAVIAGLQALVDRSMYPEDTSAAQAAIELIESLDNHVSFLEIELDEAENRLEDILESIEKTEGAS